MLRLELSEEAMRKHIIAVLFLVATTMIAVAAGARHTSATFHDRAYLLANALVAVGSFILTLTIAVVANARNRSTVRNYAIATALVSALVAATPIVGTSYRLNSTKKHLFNTYTQLAKNGPPFPKSLPQPWDQPLEQLVSHGYWVAEDQQSFEVYYHDASDSFAMAYPAGTWEWRGNKYTGPKSQQESPTPE